jgi:ribonuclease E
MKDDRAKFTVGRLSPNGLLEINRQRLKKELKLRTYRSCPTCSGTGSSASPELVGLTLLRRIETRAVTGRLKRVRVELHPELADAIQNERRHELAALEDEFEIRIEIIAATRLHRSEEHVEWFQRDEPRNGPDAPVAAVTVADLGDGGSGARSSKKPDGEAEAADSGVQDGAGDAPKDAPKSRKRRRGGRRRKKEAKRADSPEESGDSTPASEPAQPTEKASEKPPKKRPRRRRRRKPKPKAESQPESS